MYVCFSVIKNYFDTTGFVQVILEKNELKYVIHICKSKSKLNDKFDQPFLESNAIDHNFKLKSISKTKSILLNISKSIMQVYDQFWNLQK